jgi:hypothetical protein
MTMYRTAAVAVALALGCLACSAGTPGSGDDAPDDGSAPADARIDAGDDDPPAPPDAAAGSDGGRPDAAQPGPDDDTDGPAAALYIDTSIHPRQVWNEPFDFRMTDYPLTWAIATVHASMLLRSRCIEFSPDAVLSIALKESKLACRDPGTPNVADGCFQIESTSAYAELRQVFGARFAGEHGAVISNQHFETSALAMAHYLVFSSAMMRRYTACPASFFAAHPDGKTEHKVLCGAYNRGLWWTSLTAIFTTCAQSDVLGCFAHEIASDHAAAIADYAVGLDAAPVFDAAVGWSDLAAYWQRLRPLYPDVSDATAEAALRTAFDAARGGAETISFRSHIRVVLTALIAALPAFPTVAEVTTRACTLGYMSGTACDVTRCTCAR